MSAITDIIVDWIQTVLAPGEEDLKINASTPLVSHQILDSLQIMDLTFFLEETYGMQLPLEELTPENFETPTSIAALVNRVMLAGLGAE